MKNISLIIYVSVFLNKLLLFFVPLQNVRECKVRWNTDEMTKQSPDEKDMKQHVRIVDKTHVQTGGDISLYIKPF